MWSTCVDAIEMMFVGIGLLLWPLVITIYVRLNRQKVAALRASQERGEKLEPEALRRMGDRAPDFEYML